MLKPYLPCYQVMLEAHHHTSNVVKLGTKLFVYTGLGLKHGPHYNST